MDLNYQPVTMILSLSSYCNILIDRWHRGLVFCKTLLVHYLRTFFPNMAYKIL